MGYGGAVVMALAFAGGGYLAIHLLTNVPDVQTQALTLLPWLIAAPLIGAAAWIYYGVFTGALLTASMRRAAIQVACLYAAALAV